MSELIICKKQGIHVLHLEDILYMEKNLRKIRVSAGDSSIEFYGKFPDIEDYLDERFMCCHRSYIINLDKIVIMRYNTIFFENNERICLGRDAYGRAKKIFSSYLEENR